jgi:hypothetical protein
MRKLIASLCGAALLGLTGQAIGQDTMKSEKKEMEKMMRMPGMDANNDGMVSKEEFMKHHEMMWDKMKRNPAGLATVRDVEAIYEAGTVPSAIPGQPREKAKP